MINFIIGITTGFIAGVGYAERHENPWLDLKTSAASAVIGMYRFAAGGPKAPKEDEPSTEKHAA